MESTIRLCYYPLPSAPLNLSYGSKGSEYARASTFPHRFNHATLCLSHFSTSHQVACSFRHANCMLNRFSVLPSKNEGSDSKILRGVTGVSLVLACVLGLFNFSSKMNHKFNTSYAMPMPHFSMEHNKVTTPEVGGEVALESLLNMINAETTEHFIPGFDHEPDKASVDALKLHAVHLTKSGKKDEALKILEKEYNKWKNSEAEQYLQTALVELLIVQGNFGEARNRLDDQIDQRLLFEVDNPKLLKYEEKISKLLESYENEFSQFEKLSIAQILLNKAIVHTMLKQKEAAKWWEAFTKTLTEDE